MPETVVCNVLVAQVGRKTVPARGLATAKLLSPNVLCVRGTAHDLSVKGRSRRRHNIVLCFRFWQDASVTSLSNISWIKFTDGMGWEIRLICACKGVFLHTTHADQTVQLMMTIRHGVLDAGNVFCYRTAKSRNGLTQLVKVDRLAHNHSTPSA